MACSSLIPGVHGICIQIRRIEAFNSDLVQTDTFVMNKYISIMGRAETKLV